jgi:hypothetical protein
MLLRKITQALVDRLLKIRKTATLDLETGASLRIVSPLTGLPVATVGTTELAALDTNTRIVTTTATALSLTVTEHAERVVLINSNSTVANTFTLPLATGSGVKMTLINNIAQTQGSVVVAANGTTNTLKGCALIGDTTAETAGSFVTSASSDKVSLNRTTTGGVGPGDVVEAWDTASGVWSVRCTLLGSGTLATPFSET